MNALVLRAFQDELLKLAAEKDDPKHPFLRGAGIGAGIGALGLGVAQLGLNLHNKHVRIPALMKGVRSALRSDLRQQPSAAWRRSAVQEVKKLRDAQLSKAKAGRQEAMLSALAVGAGSGGVIGGVVAHSRAENRKQQRIADYLNAALERDFDRQAEKTAGVFGSIKQKLLAKFGPEPSYVGPSSQAASKLLGKTLQRSTPQGRHSRFHAKASGFGKPGVSPSPVQPAFPGLLRD